MFLGARYADVINIQPLGARGILSHTHIRNHVRDVLLHLLRKILKLWIIRSFALINTQDERMRTGEIELLPSTSDVSNVTLAALRRPAGRLSPIFSNFSRSSRPPFLLFALWNEYFKVIYLAEEVRRHMSTVSKHTVAERHPIRTRSNTRAVIIYVVLRLSLLCTWMCWIINLTCLAPNRIHHLVS